MVFIHPPHNALVIVFSFDQWSIYLNKMALVVIFVRRAVLCFGTKGILQICPVDILRVSKAFLAQKFVNNVATAG